MSRELEAQYHHSELDTDVNDALLPEPKSPWGTRSTRRPRNSQEVIQLDDIPPIIKSANGNIFWADEQCNRRVGLTSSEARLFLRLLQTEEPESYDYEEFKAVFDAFGREQDRLQELVDSVPWWDFNSYRQKAIWEARIQWLERMKEPRLWLLYLMARRRRILKQAATRVLERLREKRHERETNSHQHQDQPNSISKSQPRKPMMSEASQTSESQLSLPNSPPNRLSMVSDEHQASETHLDINRARSSTSERKRWSFGSGHHSHSSRGQCPVFDKGCRYYATREDIKHQVEKLMPKQTPYLVIGWFPNSASDPFEKTLQFEDPAHLFKTLSHGEKDVRGWRRLLSLKALRGFGLYKCDISRGAHIPLFLNASQKTVLAQFFLAYKASKHHSDEAVAIAWHGWVHRNLNDTKNNPLEGRYSLQLIYEWSSYRLCFIVLVPLLLSFVLGVVYMIETGDVITAWTIALYIVTAAAALVALMTIIGGLKDI